MIMSVTKCLINVIELIWSSYQKPKVTTLSNKYELIGIGYPSATGLLTVWPKNGRSNQLNKSYQKIWSPVHVYGSKWRVKLCAQGHSLCLHQALSANVAGYQAHLVMVCKQVSLLPVDSHIHRGLSGTT